MNKYHTKIMQLNSTQLSLVLTQDKIFIQFLD